MVLYLTNPCSEKTRDAMRGGIIGYIDTPKQGNKRLPGVTWCADNGCFSTNSKSPFDINKWFDWLTINATDAGTCLFATAPDVVGDAKATIERSAPWLPKIRALGYPAAFVAQDGLENLPVPWDVPWDMFDALFIGGSTHWKLGRHARKFVTEARRRGKHVHMGRVNSKKRLQYAEMIGCDSADGTYPTYGPDVNLPKLLSWIASIQDQTAIDVRGVA